jgi:sulfatase maturation enzyme AslB (radical SAM superfamily)
MTKKAIDFFRISLTTLCNMQCPYCYLKDEIAAYSGQRIKEDTLRTSLELTINSPGKNKTIGLYGGEPFLHFKAIKWCAEICRKFANKYDKNISVVICSNLSLIKDSQFLFLRDNGIKLTTTLAGKADEHAQLRPALTGKAYSLFWQRYKTASSVLDKSERSIAYCVLPSTLGYFADDIIGIFERGDCDYFTLELIFDFEPWLLNDFNLFKTGIVRLFTYIINQIKQDNFLFINHLSWQLNDQIYTDKQWNWCPFKGQLELFPEGDLCFSSLIRCESDYKDYVIGSLAKNDASKKADGLNARYSDCSFNPKSEQCVNCQADYFSRLKPVNDVQRQAQAYYENSLIKTAQLIESLAKQDENMTRYIGMCERVYFY